MEEDEMGKMFEESDEDSNVKVKTATTAAVTSSDDDEEEEEEEVEMIRPVFVPKSNRTTASTKEQQELMHEAEEDQKRRLDEKRKEVTRSQLSESLRRSEHTVDLENADNDSNFGMPSDGSDYDDDVEVQLLIDFQSISSFLSSSIFIYLCV